MTKPPRGSTHRGDTRIAAYQLTDYLERLGVERDLRAVRPHGDRAARRVGEQQSRIRFASRGTSRSAAHAADGYARATGKARRCC